jgi:hypothetical protein
VAIVLDQQVRFFPNSASLNGSESGGAHFPAGFFAFFQTPVIHNQRSGEKKGRTMNPLIQLQQTTAAILFALLLACLGISPAAQAVVPPPDGGYPGFNTAEGQNALFSLTTGAANTAVGWFSLFSDTEGSFNTATGAGTLLFNTANNNTAFGAAALLFNTTGLENTAVGTAALLNNTEGFDNTAVGFQALTSNTTGESNTANGAFALFSNTEGGFNTANGLDALSSNTTGDGNTAIGFGALNGNSTGNNNTATGAAALGNNTGDHNTANGVSALALNSSGNNNTALGELAGLGVTTADNVICIGFNVAGANVDNSCFIGNISGVEVTGDAVVVAANGQLGVAPAGSPLSANELLKQQRIVQELKATTERQAAVIALQEGQIKALTAGLQKVSAQLEASKPAPQVVNNP